MTIGQGNVFVLSRTIPAAPATVTTANNGTSLSGTTVQLGQDVGAVGNPAQLLNDRELPLIGNSFNWKGNNISLTIEDAPGINLQNLFVSDVAGSRFLMVDTFLHECWLGDIDVFYNGNGIDIHDDVNVINMISNGGWKIFSIDWNNAPDRLVLLGDIQARWNGNLLKLDDLSNVLSLDNTIHNASIQINGVAGFTGTVTPVNTITVNGGIVTNVA